MTLRLNPACAGPDPRRRGPQVPPPVWNCQVVAAFEAVRPGVPLLDRGGGPPYLPPDFDPSPAAEGRGSLESEEVAQYIVQLLDDDGALVRELAAEALSDRGAVELMLNFQLPPGIVLMRTLDPQA